MTDLKQKFEGFGKEPSPAVWENISSELDTVKVRKRWWFFFGAVILFLGLGTGIFLSKDSRNNDPKSKEIAEKYQDQKATKIVAPSAKLETGVTEDITVENSKKETPAFSNNPTPSDTKIALEERAQNKRNQQAKISKAAKFKTMNTDAVEPSVGLAEVIGNGNVTETADASNNLLGLNLLRKDKPLTPNESSADSEKSEIEERKLLELEKQFFSEILFLHALKPKQIKYKKRGYLEVIPIDCGFEGFDDLFDKKWIFSLTYKHGLTNYDIKLKKTFRTIPQESFLGTIQAISTQQKFTQYISSSPIWIESLAKRKISDRGLLVTCLEIGIRKNEVRFDDDIYYKNTNTSFGIALGYEFQAVKTKHIILSAGANLLGELTSNNSEFEPFELDYGEQLDQVKENISQNEQNNSSIVGEVSTTLLVKMHNDIGLHVKPFYKMNLSENHPSSSFFDGGEHWGVGIGVSF